MPSSQDLLSLEVPCDLYAPVAVRDALTQIHDGAWSLDDGRLIASELVGNAVRHSGGQEEHRLQIEVSRHDGRLLISVYDPGLSGIAARRVSQDGSGFGGWGLQIIEELAEDWGTERPDGYRVWAEIAAQDRGQPAHDRDQSGLSIR